MKKQITLTEEHLKLIPFINLIETEDDGIKIDINHLFNQGSHLLEDMALILNKMDKAIPNTQNDADGRAFDDETEEYLLSLFQYIADNIFHIETIIHQFSVKGGISAGTYECSMNDMIWHKI